jgi:RHS repeat-associated protein
LYNFGSRYYAPEIGRFVSPDPLLLMNPMAGLVNPQLFNLYAYANNNPVTYMDPYGLSLWGAICGGLVGGIVGAMVFVATGGNVVAAGLAGGFAGGAVSGAIDRGARGALVGGVLGAAVGVFGGVAFWGVSALTGALFGALVQFHVNVAIATLASIGMFAYGAVQGGMYGNWDVLAGFVAGFVGGMIGTYFANRLMVDDTYKDPNESRLVKPTQRDVQQTVRGANFDKTKYFVEHVDNDVYGRELHDNVTFNESEIGDSYLELRRTQSHELYHEYQEHVINAAAKASGGPGFDAQYAAENARVGYWDNRFEVEARNFSMRFQNYVPYPFASYSHYVAPALLVLAQPAAHEDRKHGEDKWRDILNE